MCNECMDTRPEPCTRYYSIWCIAVGIVFTIMGGLVLLMVIYAWFYAGASFKTSNSSSVLVYFISLTFIIIHVLCSILYIIAGVLMCLGMKREKPSMFKTGKILSYLCPIINSSLIFPSMVHLIAIRKMRKYVSERWHS